MGLLVGRAGLGVDVAGLGGVVRRANSDVDVGILDEREFVLGCVELVIGSPKIRALLSLSGSLARRDRVRTSIADHLVERDDQVLGDRMGIDDDVVTVLEVDRVIGDNLGVFADSRVHTPVLTGEEKRFVMGIDRPATCDRPESAIAAHSVAELEDGPPQEEIREEDQREEDHDDRDDDGIVGDEADEGVQHIRPLHCQRG